MRREARKLLGYFVWKITILRQKIIFFPILGGGGRATGAPPSGSASADYVCFMYKSKQIVSGLLSNANWAMLYHVRNRLDEFIDWLVLCANISSISAISWWSVYWWRKLGYPEKTTDLSQMTDKLYHIMWFEIRVLNPTTIRSRPPRRTEIIYNIISSFFRLWNLLYN